MKYLKQLIKQTWKESIIIVAFVLGICGLISTLVNHNLISGNLYDSLIGGTVSAGLIGFFVAVLIYAIQQRSDLSQQKYKAETFYTARLVPSILELFERDPSPWNVSGGKKFYFDNSRANSIYDLCDKYAEDILEYRLLFENNQVVRFLLIVYQIAREGYVIGEKIDQFLSNHVRIQLASQGVDEDMDIYVLRYLKARLFTDNDERWALVHVGRYLDAKYRKIYDDLENNSDIVFMQYKIKETRQDLENEIYILQEIKSSLPEFYIY